MRKDEILKLNQGTAETLFFHSLSPFIFIYLLQQSQLYLIRIMTASQAIKAAFLRKKKKMQTKGYLFSHRWFQLIIETKCK